MSLQNFACNDGFSVRDTPFCGEYPVSLQILPVMAGFLFAIHPFAANTLCRCIVLRVMVGWMFAIHTFVANILCRGMFSQELRYKADGAGDNCTTFSIYLGRSRAEK